MVDVRALMSDVVIRPRLLGVVIVAVALLSAAPAFAQANDPAHQQFLFGYKLLQRGEDDLAADAFDAYLQEYPSGEQRGDVLYYRALLYRREGRSEAAADLLERTPRPQLVPDYAVQLLRGQALADIGEHAEAVKALEQIDVARLDTKVAASVLYLRGLTHRGAGNRAAAAKSFQAAADMDSPLRSRALVDLARTQAAMGQADQAVQTLRASLALDDATSPAEAALLAGDLSAEAGRAADAVEFYSMVISGYPSSKQFGPAVVGAMRAHYAAGAYERVTQTLDRHRDLLPLQDRVQAIYLAGSAQQARGEHEAAAELFAQISQDDTPTPLLEKTLYKRAVSLFELERYDAVREVVGRLTKLFPRTELMPDAAFLLAAVDAAQGQVERGAARLTELIELGDDHPYHDQALRLRATLYERHGEADAAIGDYRRFLRGGGHATADHAAAALRLTALLSEHGHPGEAADVAGELLGRDGLSPEAEQEAMYRRAVALGRAERYDAALKQLDQLAKAHPLNAFRDRALYQRGLLLISLGRVGDATEPLRDAAGRESLDEATRIAALRVLGAAQRDQGQDDAAAQTLERLVELGASIGSADVLVPSERVWLGRYAVNQGEPAEALGYLSPVLERADSLKPELVAEALYHAGRAHRLTGDYERAADALGVVLAMGVGFDYPALLEQARVLAAQGQTDAALAQYNDVLTKRDTGIEATALYESALLYRELAEQRLRLDDAAGAEAAEREARMRLKKLVLLYPFEELFPLPQRAYLELADIQRQAGDPTGWRAELEELAEKYPDSAYAAYARALLAQAQQRLGEAEELLRAARDKRPDEQLRRMIDARLKEVEG